MTLRGRLRGLTNGVLGRWDLAIVRRSSLRADPFAAGEALARASRRGLAVRTIVDIGASDGKWSAMAMRHFPDCLVAAPRGRSTTAPGAAGNGSSLPGPIRPPTGSSTRTIGRSTA